MIVSPPLLLKKQVLLPNQMDVRKLERLRGMTTERAGLKIEDEVKKCALKV